MKPLRTPLAFLWNLILAYLTYGVCRLIYWAENASAFEGFWTNPLRDILAGAWKFDTSAILYTNALYALLMLVPLHWKEGRAWQHVAKWLFVIVNGLAVVVNLADAAYFPYTGRRTTTTVFKEFSNEGNLGSVFGVEVLRHWYLVLAGVLLIALLWKAYKRPTPQPLTDRKRKGRHLAAYYLIQLIFFVPSHSNFVIMLITISKFLRPNSGTIVFLFLILIALNLLLLQLAEALIVSRHCLCVILLILLFIIL